MIRALRKFERLRDRHAFGQPGTDEVLTADLLLGKRQGLLGDVARDHNDAIIIGKDQVMGVDGDAPADDRYVVPDDVEPAAGCRPGWIPRQNDGRSPWREDGAGCLGW